jgi:pimeloyl-ACP methyl ester carboxylesterase
MISGPPPDYVSRPDGTRLAYRLTPGRGPALIFFPGYRSDMQGSKAIALEAWAVRTGHPFLRFDYSGCGESDGAFEDETLQTWLADALCIIEHVLSGTVILIGSSMGGWLAVHAARALGGAVKGLVGIAAAPDFTDWGFTDAEKHILRDRGRLERPSDYSDEPMVTTDALWQSGAGLRVLGSPIALACPVRLIQGQCDRDVPWKTALQLAEDLRSADVQVILVKDGDHRLSRDQDIALLTRIVSDLLECL